MTGNLIFDFQHIPAQVQHQKQRFKTLPKLLHNVKRGFLTHAALRAFTYVNHIAASLEVSQGKMWHLVSYGATGYRSDVPNHSSSVSTDFRCKKFQNPVPPTTEPTWRPCRLIKDVKMSTMIV